MPTLYTLPSSVPVAKTEIVPISQDFTALILAGDVLTSPTSALFDQDGNSVALSDSPTINADLVSIQQIIRGTALTAGKTYRLDITCTLSTNKKLTASTNIICPY